MDEQSFLRALSQFIGFRTIAGREDEKRRCANWIADEFLSSAKLPIRRGDVDGAPYVFLQHPSPSFLWFAHIDVVPALDEQFTLQRDGSRAIGRGTKDMKGATLPFLMAYREYCRAGSVPPVSILCTSDEETAGRSIPVLFEQGLLKNIPVAFTPDTGSEPFLVTSLKGALWAELTCTGKSAHAAMPWEGHNPISALSRALVVLAERFPPTSKDEWKMTVTPTELSGSETKNQIPSKARCILDVRFPGEVHRTPDAALAFLQSILPEDCELREIKRADPISIDPSHSMARRIKRIAESVLQEEVVIGKEHGSSDARYFGSRGIPAFLYGPAGGGLHAHDEWVSIPSLLQHHEISKRLLEELMVKGSMDQDRNGSKKDQ